MYAAGNSLVILEVGTMTRRVIFGLDGGGVGCFAVHPNRKLVAVGEKGAAPNIYVYKYPTFEIAKVSVLSLPGACAHSELVYVKWSGSSKVIYVALKA